MMKKLLPLMSLLVLLLSCDKEKPQAPLRSNPLDENNSAQPIEFAFNVALTETNDGLQLSWDAVEHPELTGYRIYRTIESGKRDAVFDAELSALTWADTSETTGRNYHYEVVLLMNNGVEWISDSVPLVRWAGPPALSIEGEKSGIYVPSKEVQLRTQAEGASHLQLGPQADLEGVQWQAYKALIPYGLNEGSNTIYARVVYDTGDTSEVAQLDLYVDQRPSAVAGPDQHELVGNSVSLDGGESADPEGESLAYRWRVPTGVTLSNSTDSKVEIRAPQAGRYTIELVVSDGRWESVDEVEVAFSHRPVADAGMGGLYGVGESVVLDGVNSSDADGDRLTYEWTASSGASLTNSDSSTPTFVAEESGTYTVELVVSDGIWVSEVSRVEIQVSYRPVAVVGDDIIAAVGDVVVLDGSGSSGGNGDGLKYSWRVPDEIELDDAGSATPSFTASEAGSYTVSLVVSDGELESNEVQLMIEVSYRPEAVIALSDSVVGVGESVLLDGTGSSDGDGSGGFSRSLTYSWTVSDGATLKDATSSTPTFIAEEPGTYTVELVVSDGIWVSKVSRVELVVTESTGSAQIQGTVTESTGNAQVEGTIQD